MGAFFVSRNDAVRFLYNYVDHYDLDTVDHYQLFEAEIQPLGTGDEYVWTHFETDGDENLKETTESEQTDVTGFTESEKE